MATAIEFLRAAKGEASLASALGLWRQHVSQVVDALLGGGIAAPDYGEAKIITPQAIAGFTNLILDAQGLTRGLGYNTTTGTWVLNANKVYRLTGFGYADTWSGATAGLKVQWVDDNNVVLSSGNVDCAPAQLIPPNSSGNISINPITEMIYKAPTTFAGLHVKLRVTGLTGTASIPASAFTSIVEEIVGGV